MDQQAKTNLPPNPRAKAGFLSIIFFWWLNPFMRLGHEKDLELTDLYQVLPEDLSSALGDKLEREWNKELQKAAKTAKGGKSKKPSLFRALTRCFAWDLMKPGLLAFVEECGVKIIQPVCLALLLKSFQTNAERWEAYLNGTGVVFSIVCYIFTHHSYFYTADHVGMKLRVSTCSLVYRKCLKLSKSALGQTTIGQLTNLLTNDVSRLEIMTQYVHFLWVGPIQTGIILSLLWFEIGASGLVGLVFPGVFILFQGWIGKIFSDLRFKTATWTDERLRIMNEIISAIRVIKMYTWEKFEYRNELGNSCEISSDDFCRREVNVIRKTSYYRALDASLSFTGSKVILFFTLFTFLLTGHALTAEKVFVTLLLYEKMRISMTLFFPYAVSGVAETKVTIERLENFLLLDEKESMKKAQRPHLADCAITLENARTTWVEYAAKPTLSCVSCTVIPGQLFAIVGPVGSGKTSLLHVLLQELPLTSGGLSVKGKIAYASQEPWVFSGTVRQNILCGEPFDTNRYQKITQVCALDEDLALLPNSDRTYVGEKGVILSGGQKARINLARALYLDADIYLLDDPLSAVDTHTGRHLFDHGIMGFLKDKIRVLATHQTQYLKVADQVLVLKQGTIEEIGTFSALEARGIDFTKVIASKEEEANDDKDRNTRPSEFHGTLEKHFNSAHTPRSVVLSSSEKPTDPIQEEMQCKGNVSWKIYTQYFQAGGTCLIVFGLILLNILTQICFSGSEYWLGIWVNGEERHTKIAETSENHMTNTFSGELGESNRTVSASTLSAPINRTFDHEGLSVTERFLVNLDRNVGIKIYAGIVVGLCLFSLLRAVLFFSVCMKASTTLHNKMFHALIRTSVRFFDTNPVGRTLNRFSKDVGIMDEMLPTTMFDFISVFLRILGICTVIGLVNPWLILPCLVLGAVCYFFRGYYVKTSRDIKRLEGVTRSPIFSHLSASLMGLTTLRAHGAEHLFQMEFDLHQDFHSSAWFLFMTTTRWFATWLDWACVLYLACVTYGCLVMTETTTRGDAGLVITLVIEMMGYVQWGLRQSAEVENQMTSVERIMEYCNLPPDPPLESAPGKHPPNGWPQCGEIKFKNTTLQYSKCDPPVLRNITCTIRPKEKVGIVGRTGAGKSSLIAALFRMVEPDGEIQIDGIVSKEIGLHALRSQLSIIPQDPVLFRGTLRKNLDPFGQYPDDSLWEVLEEVKLKDAFSNLPQGLNYQVAEGGSNFSLGQRQLLCLSRAILKQNRILVLDEATANVDHKTDALIQETIRRKFQHCTVLTIAHRLNTIMDSDRVMVIHAGSLEEFDEPNILLGTRTSLFYSLVEETGIDQAQYLKDVAAQAAMKRKTAATCPDTVSQVSAKSTSNDTLLRESPVSQELNDCHKEAMSNESVEEKETKQSKKE